MTKPTLFNLTKRRVRPEGGAEPALRLPGVSARGSLLAWVAGLLSGVLLVQAQASPTASRTPLPPVTPTVITAASAPHAPTPVRLDFGLGETGRGQRFAKGGAGGASAGIGVSRVQLSSPARKVSAAIITERAGPGRTITLTFDDGPDPVWTPKVLALLEQAGVRAIFCMIGERVRQHPGLARAVLRHGHVLCNHTTTHDLDLGDRPGPRIDLEITQTNRLIRLATGVQPTWFRAPGGGFTPFMDKVAALRGLQPLSWSDDPRDWSRPGVGAIVHTVLSEAHPGAIVLMHDGGGNRAQTVAALRILLRELPRRGYRFTLL